MAVNLNEFTKTFEDELKHDDIEAIYNQLAADDDYEVDDIKQVTDWIFASGINVYHLLKNIPPYFFAEQEFKGF